MQPLNHILRHITTTGTVGNAGVEVSGIATDSRRVGSQGCFIAVRGTLTDGHDYIHQAIVAGATAIVCETLPEAIQATVTYVTVADTAAACGHIAAAYYGHPSKGMKVVGVTGTNGKTTTATLLYKLFDKLGHCTGLISTVENRIHGRVSPATHTTPDPITLQSLLREMADAGCTHVFMEVSSHAIHQHRINGLHFTGGIFTNITHDHLDYHKTFEEYIRVKKSFFDDLPKNAFALTNADDRRGMVMLQNTQAQRVTYSLKAPALIKGKVLENNLSGLVMTVGSHEAHFRLIGIFNAYNLLAVYGAATLLGEDELDVLAVMSGLTGAEGRFETIGSTTGQILGIVDYAHTPDALLNVLATINKLRTTGGRLITLVGCGGDRDRAKRPIMAEAACEHSDQVILTTDNPRSEDPEAILDEMEAGLDAVHKRRSLRITDRKEAIKTACILAQPGDIILVAGKGHEKYQEVKGVKHHFDDCEELKNAFELLNK